MLRIAYARRFSEAHVKSLNGAGARPALPRSRDRRCARAADRRHCRSRNRRCRSRSAGRSRGPSAGRRHRPHGRSGSAARRKGRRCSPPARPEGSAPRAHRRSRSRFGIAVIAVEPPFGPNMLGSPAEERLAGVPAVVEQHRPTRTSPRTEMRRPPCGEKKRAVAAKLVGGEVAARRPQAPAIGPPPPRSSRSTAPSAA